MHSFTEKLFKQLEDQLNFITIEQKNILKRAELSISVCEKAINQLKVFIVKHKFQTQDDEIGFFKRIKPRFTSKLNYNILLFNLEKGRPLTSIKAQIKYFEKEQQVLDDYLEKNLEFYTYYRTECATLDDKYFLRDKIDMQLAVDECFFDFDRTFNTTHDRRISRIIANDMLAVYIRNELQKLEKALLEATESSVILPKPFNWTDSKASLIELIYALHSAGVFSNGRADIKEIAVAFEKIFSIDLGNYYHVYLEIRGRKTNRTKFLSLLQESLSKRMDEMDEK